MGITLDGVRWDYLSEGGHLWLTALRTDQLQGVPIKASIRRCTFRLPEGIFVKDIRYTGLRSFFKIFSGGNACKEGKIALELRRRGVPVPVVLAFGTERRSGQLKRDLLVTKEVQNGKPLYDFVREEYPKLSFHSKDKLIRTFAAFIKQLHDAGAFHKDLHLGNVLIQRAEDNDRFVIVDVDRVRLKTGKLSQKERAENLGLLLSIFWTKSSLMERFRFLKHYGIYRQGIEKRNFINAIKHMALRNSHRIWKKRSRRCLSSNTGFVKERTDTFMIYRVRRPDVERALRLLLRDPDLLVERGKILKDGRTIKAARVELGGRYYFLKRYNRKGWYYQLKNVFRRSRAIRTWSASWGFRLRHLPVPEPLICLEERRFGLLKRSYILSEFIENAQSLGDAWRAIDESGKRRLNAKLAITLGYIHQFGGFHGDLKWNNILIQQESNGERIVLSDMDASKVFPRTKSGRALKDLRRFFRDMDKRCGDGNYKAFFVSSWRKWSGQSTKSY